MIDAAVERQRLAEDRDVSLAWHTAQFAALTRGKRNRLRPLSTYLTRRSAPAQLSPADVAAITEAAAEWQAQIDGGET